MTSSPPEAWCYEGSRGIYQRILDTVRLDCDELIDWNTCAMFRRDRLCVCSELALRKYLATIDAAEGGQG